MGNLTSLINEDSPNTLICDNCLEEEDAHVKSGGTLIMSNFGHYLCDGYSQKKLYKRRDRDKYKHKIMEQGAI